MDHTQVVWVYMFSRGGGSLFRHVSSLAFLAIVLLLASCVSTKQAGNVYLTDTASVTLLPPSVIEGKIDTWHLLEGFWGERTFQAMVYTVADGEELSMTVMTPTGQTIARVSYDGREVHKELSVPFAGSLKAEYLFADFELCFGRSEEISSWLSLSGLTLEETEGQRLVKSGGKLIYQIRYQPDALVLENKLRGYRYTIRVADDG